MSVVKLASDRPREERRLAWMDVFGRHRLFAGLGKHELTGLLESALERTCAPGDVILQQGAPGDSVFFVGIGSVSVSLTRQGPEPLKLAVLRRGDFFGELALFEPSARTATVTALQKSVLLEVPGEALRELMAQHPALELACLHTVTDRLRAANELMLSLKLSDAPEALKLLEAKLTAEVRVFDASLKAAHAIFEQTRMRSDEVISNADRTRSRLTYVASSLVTVFTLAGMALGGLGLREVWRLKSLQDDVAEVTKAVAQFKNDGPRLMKDIEAINETTEEARKILVRDQVEAVQQALADGTPSEAKAHFESLDRLGWVNESNVLNLLYQVEAALVAPRSSSGVVVKAEIAPDSSRQDFTDLLSMMAERAKAPETQAKAYSLFLANAILVDKPRAERQETLERFRNLLAQHKSEPLLSKENWEMLEERLSQGKQRDEFEQIRQLVPAGRGKPPSGGSEKSRRS